MYPAAFAEVVASQSGVVSVAQAVAAGVPPRTVQGWARTWRRLRPGVYLVAGHRLTRLLRQAGITGWRVGEPFGPYLIDVAFPEAKLAIEVDGWAWHVDADRFRGDRRKGNALVRSANSPWRDAALTAARCRTHQLGSAQA